MSEPKDDRLEKQENSIPQAERDTTEESSPDPNEPWAKTSSGDADSITDD
jgi:hypothetical protein